MFIPSTGSWLKVIEQILWIERQSNTGSSVVRKNDRGLKRVVDIIEVIVLEI